MSQQESDALLIALMSPAARPEPTAAWMPPPHNPYAGMHPYGYPAYPPSYGGYGPAPGFPQGLQQGLQQGYGPAQGYGQGAPAAPVSTGTGQVTREEFDDLKKGVLNSADNLFRYLKSRENASEKVRGFVETLGFKCDDRVALLPKANPFTYVPATKQIDDVRVPKSKRGRKQFEALVAAFMDNSKTTEAEARKKAAKLMPPDSDSGASSDDSSASKHVAKKAKKSSKSKKTEAATTRAKLIKVMQSFQDFEDDAVEELKKRAEPDDMAPDGKITSEANVTLTSNMKIWGYISWAARPYKAATSHDKGQYTRFKKANGLPVDADWDGTPPSDSD